MISVIPCDADVLTSHLVPAERGRLSCASNAVGVWPALCAELVLHLCCMCLAWVALCLPRLVLFTCWLWAATLPGLGTLQLIGVTVG